MNSGILGIPEIWISILPEFPDSINLVFQEYDTAYSTLTWQVRQSLIAF